MANALQKHRGTTHIVGVLPDHDAEERDAPVVLFLIVVARIGQEGDCCLPHVFPVDLLASYEDCPSPASAIKVPAQEGKLQDIDQSAKMYLARCCRTRCVRRCEEERMPWLRHQRVTCMLGVPARGRLEYKPDVSEQYCRQPNPRGRM